MLALIPARGGSKRVPRKNLHLFFGHPLLAYAIAAAHRSQLFETVVVSTDDPEIAAVARTYGGQVLRRPDALASDSATLVDVAEHALLELHVGSDRPFCLLMPNCPLRRSDDIRAHWRAFDGSGRRFQVSAVPFRGVYPDWSLAIQEDGIGSWAFGERLIPSQTLRRLVCPTGAIWWTRSDDFLAQHRFYGSPFHVEMMDADRGLDIDTLEDLALAELLVLGYRARDGVDPLEPVA